MVGGQGEGGGRRFKPERSEALSFRPIFFVGPHPNYIGRSNPESEASTDLEPLLFLRSFLTPERALDAAFAIPEPWYAIKKPRHS